MVESSYTPVQWTYREVIEEAIAAKTEGKVFYFCPEEFMCDSEGRVERQEEVAGEGIFIVMDNGKRIRIDRIITLFGKPGAAFDEYEAYGNACMDCTGGYTDL